MRSVARSSRRQLCWSRPRLPPTRKPKFGSFGVDLSSMDKSVKPGENFFLYVNGKWLKTATIPPDRSQTGSFQDLQILSEQRMRAIVDDLEKKPRDQLSDEEKKLRDLYDAFEDTAAIEANGLKPIQKDLDYLAGPADPGRCGARHGVGAAGDRPASTTSASASTTRIPTITRSISSQSGLGLPDRDYYLKDDKALADTRTAYRQYLSDMMGLAGMSDTEARADRILALETEIAKGPMEPRRPPRRRQDLQSDDDLGPEDAGAGFRLGRLPGGIAYPADHGQMAASVMPSWRKRPPSNRWRRSSRPRRSRPGAIISRCIICSISRPICPSASTTAILPSTARCWAATRSSSTGRPAAFICWTAPWARRWASSMSRAISRPSPKPRPTNWSPIC